MKEQIFIPYHSGVGLEPHLSRLGNDPKGAGVNKGAALAIPRQTVYAEGRGSTPMPDVTQVEGVQKTAQKPPEEKQVAKNDDKEAKVAKRDESREEREGKHNTRQANPDRVEAARKAWEAYSKKKRLTAEEQEAIKELIKRGIPPISGGADPLLPTDFTDPTLHRIVAEINDEIARIGVGQPLELNYLNRQTERIQNLIDTGAANAEEGRRLLRSFGAWRGESEEAIREERGAFRGEEVEALNQSIRQDMDKLKGETLDGAPVARTPDETIEALRGRLRNAIAQLPITRGELIIEAIRQIARDEEMCDIFQNRIIGIPDSFPDSHYEENIDFYTKSTLTSFYSEVQKIDPERARKYAEIGEARSNFHNIQWSLSKGDLEFFSKLATSVTDKSFNAVVGHVGVPTVNRLYDEAFFAVVLSQKSTMEADDFEKIQEWVRRRFETMVDGGTIKYKGEGGYERLLLRPEIERALTVGLNFFTAKIRGAELIASAAVENTGGARQWGSYKYESVVRLVNPTRFLLHKFDVGMISGGQWLSEQLRAELEKANTKIRPGELDRIGKIRRELFETSAPLGKTGFEWGWRIYEGYFNQIPLRITRDEYDEWNRTLAAYKEKYPFVEGEEGVILGEEGDYVYVKTGQYMDRWLTMTKNFRDFGKGGRDLEAMFRLKGRTRKETDANVERFLIRKFQSVMEQLDFYNGIVLAQGDIPEEVKVHLWRKSARNLPLRIAYFLADERDSILRDTYHIDITTETGKQQWEELEEKIARLQELRLLKSEDILDRTQEESVHNFGAVRWGEFAAQRAPGDILTWYDSLPPGERTIELTATDMRIIRDFMQMGEQKAEILARVDWPYAAFMEDAIFKMNYSKLGPEFSRRRIVDAVEYSKAGQELLEAFRSVDLPIEETVKHFETALRALEAPMLEESAQDQLFPFMKTFLQFRRLKGETGLNPFKWGRDRSLIIGGIRRLFKENQSVAQEFYGHTAPADDVDDEYEITQAFTRRGILRRGGENKYGKKYDSLLEKMRKELGATAANLILHMIKTWGPLIFLLLPYEFIKQLREAK